jgi:hypothetical protein
MKVIISVLLGILSLTNTASAELYMHNGSLVELNVEGAIVFVVYSQPSPMMIKVGAQEGAPAFDGAISRRTGEIGGNAYKYASRCGHFPFAVTGRFRDTSWSILNLKGMVPIVNVTNCRVTGYVPISLQYARPE